MSFRLAPLVLLPSALAACGVASPASEAQLLVPADVEFPWNGAYNEADDHRAAVVPLDVMVYDGVTGEPVGGVDVELSSDEAVFVDPDLVITGDAGCESCLWDAYRDEWIDLPAEAGRGALVLTSDAAGLVRAYAVVDALPEVWGAFAPASVRVRIDGDEQALRLEPR